ncbi:sperm-specific antigen 2 [Anoplophora glabripennis]|uniref:sperm-specific antigen 2 n=1 Tax=Anoplophora glabripennis TaxID=217634 RepID=UPI0008742F1C|nr:sperm-specific antigen 2 [Anoplophora glabripennis]XP_018571227.1 sperm-specific antigen 2 [Anoplophora glabripennis]XP_023310350.1 sperm-specific antigen 2 [Anoplophora glabripennis]
MMRKSPITVQQWVDTLPPAHITQTPPSNMFNAQVKNPRQYLKRDLSLQSDDGSSQCSSVESVLELRKPDPETVLMELGFGPPNDGNSACRIPNRFLQPSKVLPEVDFNKFLEQYGQRISDTPQSHPASPGKPRPKSY